MSEIAEAGKRRADELLAVEARYKYAIGQEPDQKEKLAYSRVEKAYLAYYGERFVESVTKAKYLEWSGKSAIQQIYQQSDNHGVPIRGDGISIPKVIRWLHEYLTTIGISLRGPRQYDEDPDLEVQAGGSPNLERLRKYKADIAKVDYEKKVGDLVDRTQVIEMHSRWSRILRSMCERVGKRFGVDAYNLVVDALDECEEIVKQFAANDSE